MTTRQLRAKPNTLKRKHALPLPIRRRPQIQCHDWTNAEANNQPLPNTPCQVSQFAKNAPRLPNYLNLPRYIVRRHRAKTNPNPNDLIRALLPQTRQSGQHPRIMNLHLPARQPIQSPQNPPKRRQMGGKINKISPTNPQKAAPPKAKAQPNGWKWGEIKNSRPQPTPNLFCNILLRRSNPKLTLGKVVNLVNLRGDNRCRYAKIRSANINAAASWSLSIAWVAEKPRRKSITRSIRYALA